jgi:hypothetical protein
MIVQPVPKQAWSIQPLKPSLFVSAGDSSSRADSYRGHVQPQPRDLPSPDERQHEEAFSSRKIRVIMIERWFPSPLRRSAKTSGPEVWGDLQVKDNLAGGDIQLGVLFPTNHMAETA